MVDAEGQMADRASRPADAGVMAAQGIRCRGLPGKLTKAERETEPEMQKNPGKPGKIEI